jgi:alanyl-tRNA synthetase
MTEKLYYTDSHIISFEAGIISCEKYGNSWSVILDRTAFFPEGGGQPADTGMLGGVNVLDVREKGGEVRHITGAPLEAGKVVRGLIDWDVRFRRMQNHSGEHLVSGLAYKLYGLNNVGFHMGGDFVTVDFDGELDRVMLDNIERLANIAVSENVPVKAYFPNSAVLNRLKYRSKLDLTENVRIVNIKGYDTCACCAPHVNKTGEIGIIKLLDFMRHRGGVRVSMLCGMDALIDYRRRYESTAEISSLLSVRQYETAQAVRRLLDEEAALKLSLNGIRKQLVEVKATLITETEGNLLLFEPMLDADSLRELVTLGMDRCNGICAGFTGGEGDWKYVIGSRHTDMRQAAKDINTALHGRGGGKCEMIQGSFACTRVEIESYFKKTEGNINRGYEG